MDNFSSGTEEAHNLPKAQRGLVATDPEQRSVLARSYEEALKEVETGTCTELDFTYHVAISSRAVKDLQARIIHRKEMERQKKTLSLESETIEELSDQLADLQTRAITIFQALKTNTRLEVLRVDGKDLGEASLSVMAASLETNRSLIVLDLSSNHSTIASAQALGAALKWHCLQELHLDFNYMGNDAVDAMCEGLQGNSALKVLGLRGNNLGPEFPQSVMWLLTPRPLSSSDIVYKGSELFESSLRTVHVDFNNIKDLPIRLGNVAKLEMTVTHNPIHHPAPEIVASGWKSTWKVLREEWKEYEIWHEEQTRLHNLMLKQNSILPKFMPARDYAGVTADDL